MQNTEEPTYSKQHKPARSFANRSEYLDNELSIMNPKRWRLNLPGRDFRFGMRIPVVAVQF